jgi:hypothetical protein
LLALAQSASVTKFARCYPEPQYFPDSRDRINPNSSVQLWRVYVYTVSNVTWPLAISDTYDCPYGKSDSDTSYTDCNRNTDLYRDGITNPHEYKPTRYTDDWWLCSHYRGG